MSAAPPTRWAMGILWVLCEGGPASFRTLQERCETISPSVLNRRLWELQAAKLIEKSDQGYMATKPCFRLHARLVPLGTFAKSWSTALSKQA